MFYSITMTFWSGAGASSVEWQEAFPRISIVPLPQLTRNPRAIASKTARCRNQFKYAINHKQLICYLDF